MKIIPVPLENGYSKGEQLFMLARLASTKVHEAKCTMLALG